MRDRAAHTGTRSRALPRRCSAGGRSEQRCRTHSTAPGPRGQREHACMRRTGNPGIGVRFARQLET
jgi:hypothetical protein